MTEDNLYKAAGVLFVVLFALKLAGVVTWSWWIILAPFWVPWALLGLLVVGMGASLLPVALWEALTWK